MLPENDQADIRLFCPAIIDYSYWLADQAVSPHADQIDVMSAITAMGGRRYAVHGWISFCPWRQLVDEMQFGRIQDAVMSGGAIGVKVYPVMGFYPIGNEAAAARGEVYPQALTELRAYGRRLDDALRTLYHWCQSEGVPILAHCSYSQYPGSVAQGIGLRGAPDGWDAVLTEYPHLRLDIGHGGGLWHVPTSAKGRPRDPPWTERVVRILGNKTYTHVAADFADYSMIAERDDAEKASNTEATKALRGWLDVPEKVQARGRIMYGSDWSMLAQDHPWDRKYYGLMKTRFVNQIALSNDEKLGMLGRNAARLIGISKVDGRMPATRTRLEAFYKRYSLNTEILALWD